MIKRPIIDPELAKEVQEYANRNFNGNFTESVDALIRSSIRAKESTRKLSEALANLLSQIEELDGTAQIDTQFAYSVLNEHG